MRRDYDTNRLAAALSGQTVGPFEEVVANLDEALAAGPREADMTPEMVELRRALHLRAW